MAVKKGRNGGDLILWERGQSGNPKGRPRKVLSELGKIVGTDFSVSLSKDDKFQILESLLEMSLEDLKKIALDKSTPAFMVVIASAIRKDITMGRATTMTDLMDRFFGKPKQAVEHTGEDGKPISLNISNLTDAELAELIKE